MFEAAEIPHAVSDEQYAQEVPALRVQLLDAQLEMLERADKGLVVVVSGVEGAGKGDTVNLLQTWLDARHAWVHGFTKPNDYERALPPYHRYWRVLPPRGRISILFGSWYTHPIVSHVAGRSEQSELDARLDRVRHFERMLTDEGYVLLKLWFHLSEKQLKRRLKSLEKTPSTRWRVTERDWDYLENYDAYVKTSTRALRETSNDYAPWTLVAGADPNYRHLKVGNAVLQALTTPRHTPVEEPRVDRALDPPDGVRILDAVNLNVSLDKKKYRKKLESYQGKLSLAVRDEAFKKRGIVAVFEGWDAAGKGGAIRRVTAALDARMYHAAPIAAPTDEELARPYLWRFWRNVPALGKVMIFDRSWYGRVLVERVEGFAKPADWKRAYAEINDFEEQLSEQGLIVCKFWLHIDPDEQLARFKAREETGFKRYKLTDEDWRNREKWADYERAVHEMVERTSSEIAPWTIVAANDKRHARIQVLQTLVERLG